MDDQASGVVLGFGSWFGGWGIYFDEGQVVLHHAFSQRDEDQYEIRTDSRVGAGRHTLVFEFDYDGGGLGAGGTATISVDGEELASGRIEQTVTIIASHIETFDVGRDRGVPVVDNPAGQVPLDGEIHQLAVEPGPLGLLPF